MPKRRASAAGDGPHLSVPGFWRVRYMLKGKPLAEVQVEAVSEAQALAMARPLVKANIRRLADKTIVERPA